MAESHCHPIKIQYQSDIHLEYFENAISYSLPKTDADVIVLAGDIGNTCQRTFDWVLEQTHGKPTLLCLGNHEGYHQCWQDAMEAWSSALSGSHVHLLNNDVFEIHGVQFLGGTLWTDYCISGVHKQLEAMQEARKRMNDHRFILFRDELGTRPFKPSDALSLNIKSMAFLRAQLKQSFDGKRVIISHHAPSILSIPEMYRSDILCGAFTSDCRAFIDNYTPDLWIHGHLHNTFDYYIGKTRILCNPRGYEDHELNDDFESSKMVVI